MSQESFEKLYTELRPYIQKNKTRFRDPISVKKQVAAILYYLADEDSMRAMANSFGIGKSTVSKIIRSVLFLLQKIFLSCLSNEATLLFHKQQIIQN